MQNTNILLSLGAIGVTFAGFIGIAATLGDRNDRHWNSAERLRLGFMLTTSLASSLFSYVPILVYHFGVSDSNVLPISSMALAFSFIALYIFYFFERSRLKQDELAEFSWKFGVPIQVTFFGIFFLLVRNALGLSLSEFGPYLLALLWLLGVAVLQFTRLLFGMRS